MEIYLPGVRSLKEKRKHIKSLKDRLKNKFNLSVSEVGYQEFKQRSKIGLCLVSGEHKMVKQNFEKIKNTLKRYPQLAFRSRGVEIEKK